MKRQITLELDSADADKLEAKAQKLDIPTGELVTRLMRGAVNVVAAGSPDPPLKQPKHKDTDREDGLSAAEWREFERLRWNKDADLQAEFADFEDYWAFLQNQGRTFTHGGGVRAWTPADA